MDQMIFPASAGRGWFVLIVSVVFVLGGVLMLPENPLMGWLSVVFGGLGTVGGLLVLLPGGMAIALDEQGYELRTFSRKNRTLWADIEHMGMFRVHSQEMIGIRYRAGYRHQSGLSRLTGGYDGAVPANYAIPLPQLLAQMQTLHRRYHAANPR